MALLQTSCGSALRWIVALSYPLVVLGLVLSSVPASGIAEPIRLDADKSIRQFVFDVWRKKDGLPSDNIRDIAQTPDGYLWLATPSGLVRFDGVPFVTFNAGNTAAFRNSSLHDLHVMRDGELWIASFDGGVLRFLEGRFEPFGTEQGFTAENVRALFEDRQGAVWLGTRAEGLWRYFDGAVERVDVPDALQRAEVIAFHQTDECLWVGAETGLFCLRADGSVRELGTADGLSAPNVNTFADSADGRLWVGTGLGLDVGVPASGGLAWGDPTSGEPAPGASSFRGVEPQRDGRRGPLPVTEIDALLVDRSGTLWLTLNEVGLGRLVNGELEIFGRQEGLPDDRIRTLFQDLEGNLWAGSYSGGLYRFKEPVVTPISTPEGLIPQMVTGIFEDRQGGRWAGLMGAGVLHVSDGTMRTYSTTDGLPSDSVWSIAEDGEGAIWLATSEGLVRLRGDRPTVLTTAEGLPSDDVRVVYLDPLDGKTLWIGTAGSGVARVVDGTFMPLSTEHGLADPRARFFLRDRAGAMWIGTDRGLNRFQGSDPASGIERFDRDDGLRGLMVITGFEDSEGTLWLGTNGGGVTRFKNGTFRTFTAKEGLLSEQAWAILEDGSGHLWMSSDEGIFRVAKAQFDALDTGRLRRLDVTAFGVADGMKHPECNGWGFPNAAGSGSDRLWFPTVEGIVEARPEALTVNRNPPPVVLEELWVERIPVPRSAGGQGTVVRAGSHDFEFHYTAPSLRGSSRMQFRYRLEGYDRDWIEAGTRRVAYYTNIPHGSYRFQVVAANEDGVWNQKGAAWDLTVEPHFYETAPFAVAVALLSMLGLFGAYRFRLRQVRARNRELEQKVMERTRDLAAAREAAEAADRAKAAFLANMSHEIRTPMAGVLGILEVLSGSDLDESQRRHLEMAKFSGRSLQALVDDILDLSKIEAGKLEPSEVEFDLREWLRKAVTSFVERAESKGLELVWTPCEGVRGHFRGDPVRLGQVLTNLIGNAVKFTDQGTVRVRCSRLEPQGGDRPIFRFEVQDDGIGIAPENQARLFEAFSQAGTSDRGGTGLGLAICKELAELMGGSVGVESRLGEGSTFWFNVPLAPVDDPSATSCATGEADSGLNGSLSGRILLVEDDPINREIGLALLEQIGVEVDHVADGEQAVRAVKENDYGLVLMDWRMPVMDGFEATAAIREWERHEGRPRLPVVALTANAMRGDKEKCLAADMDDYLTKPFTSESLAEKLRAWL